MKINFKNRKVKIAIIGGAIVNVVTITTVVTVILTNKTHSHSEQNVLTVLQTPPQSSSINTVKPEVVSPSYQLATFPVDDGTLEGRHKAQVAVEALNKSLAGVTTIGDNAFNGTQLPNGFQLPNTVTKISNTAFFGATLPEGFVLPDSVKTIGVSAFAHASLPSTFKLPEGIESIGNNAFMSSKINSTFTFPKSITKIPEALFVGAYLQEGFNLPSWITEIGDYAFSGVGLPKSFTIPKEIKTIKEHAFTRATFTAACLVSSDLPQIEIGDSAFSDASFEKGISINNVLSIGNEAFRGSNLSVGFRIPRTVTSIGSNAFTDSYDRNIYEWIHTSSNGEIIAGSALLPKISKP